MLLAPTISWAAAVTHRIGTADTGNTPNTSGAFTPAVDDLLIGCVVVSGSAETAPVLSSSVGTTFSLIGARVPYSAGANSIYCFVADSLVTSATSQTVTWTGGGDEGTGSVIFVESVSGMSRTGTSAIRQSAAQSNQAAGGTPAPAFSAAALTENVTIGLIGNSTNPATMTPPTSWTEPASTGDLGYATPTTGGEIVFRDSGFTGTTITWGGTSASVFASAIVELDTSAAATCAQSIALLGVGCR